MQWDLTDILASLDAKDTKPYFDELERLVQEVEAVEDRLETLTRKDVEAILHTQGRLREVARRLSYRGMLAFSSDTTDDEAKTFMERTRQITTEAGNRVRFFSHWLKHLDEDRLAQLTPEDPELAHYVKVLRLEAPYTLEQEIEEVMADKDMAGVSAVRQAREILTSSLRFTDPESGEEVTQSDILKHIHGGDRQLRRAAYQELFRVFGEHEALLAHIYRSIIRDWNTENLKHRGYPRSMTPMNMANEVSDEVVTTMLGVCRERREVWQRYFAWKAQRVGEPFTRYDIYAPIEAETLEVPFDEARETVMQVYQGFHPTFHELAQRVFDEEHVDAFPRPKKRGGAFCATPLTDMTPYVLLNHTDDARSVSTLAHEFGHAIHSMLAAERHPLVSSSPLPLAETASVFSELLLHHHLVAEHPEAAEALTNERLGDLYATIQRQAYFAEFESKAHDLVMEGQPTQAINHAYYELLEEQFGDLDVPEAFSKEWLIIPHFNASPFYVSSYSFGALLSISLYKRYQEDPSFAESILAILAAGGSRDPAELLAEHGIDITQAGFWHGGMDVVEGMVEELGA
ncbi:MAG: M3 family oligoendopeptidase [Candidatus Thermoplasmatota archaeon]|nr:M3 family oligoendopeptidase [Candidatus Thermoplasmatota archaeon]